MTDVCLIAAFDPWVIQLLRVFAEESGFRVLQAFEGQEIVPLVTREKPEVILLESQLPGNPSGLDVINMLMEDPKLRDIPILIFSWDTLSRQNTKTYSKHVYLPEPVTFDDFLSALQKVGVCCPKETQTVS